jgi:hypothetical protein
MSSSDLSSQKTEPSQEKGFLGNLLAGKTPGVGNIEAAYSRGGATNNHMPGHASKLGSQDQQVGSQDHQGVGSAKFVDGISDQRQEV